jgi:hypothetical protein
MMHLPSRRHASTTAKIPIVPVEFPPPLTVVNRKPLHTEHVRHRAQFTPQPSAPESQIEGPNSARLVYARTKVWRQVFRHQAWGLF